MEELLNQILENQVLMKDQFIKLQENQMEIVKQMNDRFERIENRLDNLEKQMNEI